jgi:hypothetical protein
MKLFKCQHCDQIIYFENHKCEKCGQSARLHAGGRAVVSIMRISRWQAQMPQQTKYLCPYVLAKITPPPQ